MINFALISQLITYTQKGIGWCKRIFTRLRNDEYANAKKAQELGAQLCACTTPPQIMRWNEKGRVDVCPKPECGQKKYKGMHISNEALRQASLRPR